MSDSIWMKSWCYSQPTSPLKHLQSYPQPPSQMSDHLGYAAVRLKGELPGTGPAARSLAHQGDTVTSQQARLGARGDSTVESRDTRLARDLRF